MARAKPKKVTVRPRVRTGLAGVPFDDWEKSKYYVHYELDKKASSAIVKDWIKKTYSKDDAKAILALPDYHFHMYSHYVTGILWANNGLELPEKWAKLPERTVEFYAAKIEEGQKLLAEKVEEQPVNKIVLTPQQRLRNKVYETIMADIDELEDAWIENEVPDSLDVYTLMRGHDLKAAAVPFVQRRLEAWLLDYSDAYNKTCDQAVEGYSHLKRTEIKRRMKETQKMLDDLSKFGAATKAVRKTRVKKPKAADKQIASLKYLKESNDHKIMSINPVSLIGAMRLFTFNAKTRVLTEYVSQNPNGFEVKGTTLQHFSADISRCTRLRKPDDILPDILKKTPKQIDNIFKGLSTKISVPNGRLNADTVLLRVMDK
jgi:hypothetical protein